MGPPKELVIKLKDRYNLQTFIETGTYQGATAIWASYHFKEVITIERSKEVYEATVSKYGTVSNINFVLGNSRAILKAQIPQLTRPALFWLDAHWSGGETYGENDECPLIEEINTISESEYEHFIFIDDARLFCSPPPRPHRIEQWPSIDKVIYALNSDTHKYYIVIIEDAIVAVPAYAKEVVANYCQVSNTKAWEEYGKWLNESEITRGCRLIGQGLKLIGKGLRNCVKRLLINAMPEARSL